MSELQIILLGLSLLAIAFVLRRTARSRRRSQQHDPLQELQQEIRTAETSTLAHLHGLESRLHDYEREVNGKIQTQITVLNQLVREADSRIVSLQKYSRVPTPAHSAERDDRMPMTQEQHRAIIHLHQAGFEIAEIAHCLERSEAEIHSVLVTLVADPSRNESTEATPLTDETDSGREKNEPRAKTPRGPATDDQNSYAA